ncbi:Hypothetical protein TFLO_2229 [Trichococcus flocculiformis]|uniref:Uncharacterized protein n=1 Tax=Trichococcus flocculiformis TaxID=82803 RepID=A0AB38BIS7_9LACT|nr:hypothetical protein [Trichococcus flocculiformis]CZQ97629.1 Hypothetical protein TFLO_2229 [Trichococcus flocculiformis]SFH88971.1 hypothetical protein SAMN04488507_102320 [Trichococcus flocculiformis]
MDKLDRFALINDFISYIGLVLIGMLCNTFLNFDNEKENAILFLILIVSGLIISYLVAYAVKRKVPEYESKNNKSVLFYMILMLIVRWIPGIWPTSIVELILFLTFLFLLVVVRNVYIEKKAAQQ